VNNMGDLKRMNLTERGFDKKQWKEPDRDEPQQVLNCGLDSV